MYNNNALKLLLPALLAATNLSLTTAQAATEDALVAVDHAVDPATASYRNSIAAQLARVWSDRGQGAIHYVRVLENPTPRWSTCDAVRAGLPLLEDLAVSIQERAWSSPTW